MEQDGKAIDRPASLGARAASGALWFVIASLLGKITSFGAQLVLAWLLNREQFGDVGLALTAASFANILQQAGLVEILVQRQKDFDKWVAPSFWFSLTLGTIAFLAMIAAGPIAATIFDSPHLTHLIWILAATPLLNSLTSVSQAILQIQLRFRLLSIIAVVCAILTAVLTIILAALGFKAYSYIIPFPVVALVRLIVIYYFARFPIQRHLHLRLWPGIWRDSSLLIATAVFTTISLQGDNIMLGLFHDRAAVGDYYFAFNLATQTIQLVAVNLAAVMLPMYAKLQYDPPRLLNAFLRTTRFAALVATPVALLLTIAGPAAFHMLWGDRWDNAMPIFQILNIGMIFNAISIGSAGMLKSQGHFRTNLWVQVFGSMLFLTSVGIAAALGGPVLVAIAACIAWAIRTPVELYVAARSAGGTPRDLISAITPALLGGLLAGLGMLAVNHFASYVTGSTLITLVATLLAGAIIPIVTARFISPAACHDALNFLPQRIRKIPLLNRIAPVDPQQNPIAPS